MASDWRKVLDDPKFYRALSQFSMEYILEFLLAARRELGDDFDAAMIMWTIQVYVGEKAFRTNAGNVRSLRIDEPWPDELLVPVTRLDIANLTGIPRETVRRKIALLEERGFVRRVSSRGLLVSHEFAASPERAALMMNNLKALRRLIVRIEDLGDD